MATQKELNGISVDLLSRFVLFVVVVVVLSYCFFLVYLISIFVDLCVYVFLVSVCFLFSLGVVREKNKAGWAGEEVREI